MHLIPDRKVIAQGLAGIIAWLILSMLAKYNLNPPIDQTGLTLIVSWLAGYLVPPSARDIVTRLNNDLVKMAQDDKNIPVDPPKA